MAILLIASFFPRWDYALIERDSARFSSISSILFFKSSFFLSVDERQKILTYHDSYYFENVLSLNMSYLKLYSVHLHSDIF